MSDALPKKAQVVIIGGGVVGFKISNDRPCYYGNRSDWSNRILYRYTHAYCRKLSGTLERQIAL